MSIDIINQLIGAFSSAKKIIVTDEGPIEANETTVIVPANSTTPAINEVEAQRLYKQINPKAEPEKPSKKIKISQAVTPKPNKTLERKPGQEEIIRQIMKNKMKKEEQEKKEKAIIERATLLLKKARELAHNDLTLAKNSLIVAKNNLAKKAPKETEINYQALELAIEWIDRQIAKQKGEFFVLPTPTENQTIKKLSPASKERQPKHKH